MRGASDENIRRIPRKLLTCDSDMGGRCKQHTTNSVRMGDKPCEGACLAMTIVRQVIAKDAETTAGPIQRRDKFS